MSIIWRFVLVLYNLFVLFVAGLLTAASVGRLEPLLWLDIALSTQQNRIITGLLGVALIVLALIGLFYSLKPSSTRSVTVGDGFLGEVYMSIPAIKVIIFKAVKEVDGVKDIRPTIIPSREGLLVKIHMMVNPDRSVPELTKAVQEKVQEYLEKIGGLEVAQIQVLVDDFNAGNR